MADFGHTGDPEKVHVASEPMAGRSKELYSAPAVRGRWHLSNTYDYQHSQWKDHRRADYRSRPHGRGRVIDVSRAAARELDMIDSGTILVSIECQ
jgi:hypothetical protein